MALTPSNMLPLNTTAPDFTLPDTTNNMTPTSFAHVKGEQGTIVMFICNHCPFVKHVNDELIGLAHDYIAEGFGVVAISSNDAENYPDDSPENMTKTANELGYPFPYLYDESQEVAKAYDAACTPDFYVFDAEDKLVYRGQLDDSRPGNDIPVTGDDLRDALDALLEGELPDQEQTPSVGCNIKWK